MTSDGPKANGTVGPGSAGAGELSAGAPKSEAAKSTGETFGRYRLIEPLGRGGMAEVFKAKSYGVEGFEKVLVVKRIVPELAIHDEFVKMFVREAKLAVRLSHANIVQVFDLGRIDGGDTPNYFIAMEYVAGADLASVLARHRKNKEQLPLGMCAFVASEVAKALDHAHRRHDERGRPLGIVHRDISPHNILLSWDGDVKVTDFGIAKAADTITRDEEQSELEAVRATGKIPFMSPEQTRSERTDARSDLFSLGTVLYQMITSANPFVAPAVSETVRRIGAGEYPPIDLGRHGVPAELKAIVDKLLAVDPEDRFASAADVCEQLIAYSYTSGDRFSAGDLATLLAPMRDGTDGVELEPASVFEEPTSAADQTPVEIPHHSTPPPPPQSTPETGERREVTMLVVSMGGRGRGEGPDELRDRIRDLLERHGAWVEEVTSAQLVALFGLGDTDGRDAEAAVRAALVVVRERRSGAVPSAGAHSGSLNVDDGGIPLKDERLASLQATTQALARATEGQVSISPQTARLVRRSFATEPLPESARAVADAGLVVLGAHGTVEGRFVGRTDALRSLGAILAAATRSEPQLVVMRGETGLGKSRLLSESKRRLRRGEFNVAFYSASCPLNGATTPWSGLRAMLHVMCGTQEDDDPSRILEVRPRLRALGLDGAQAEAVLGILGVPHHIAAHELRSLLRSAFERMVVSLCRDRLHCFAWDDAQVIDRETLDAMLRVLQRRQQMRAVFLLAQRGELPKRIAKIEGLHVLEMAELSERETERLIETRLDARSVPTRLLELVRRCAGGHPLFVEELLRELCDTGAVQVLSGNVVLKSEAHATAPRTLRTLVGDRVSRLPQRERRVLQGIAILGEPAITPVLASILEQPLPSLDRNLTNLVARGLIRRTGATKVRFASPLYREIVLDAMPEQGRQDLHGRAASTYENADVRTKGTTAERVAEHALAAGERERAVDFFWQASAERLDSGQLEAALMTMLRGIKLADVEGRAITELSSWLSQISDTVSQVRHGAGVKDAVAATMREVHKRGDTLQKASALVDVARAFGAVNLFEEAYEAIEKIDFDAIDEVAVKQAALAAEIELAGRQGVFVRAAKAADRLEALGPIEDTRAMLVMALARAGTGDCERGLELLDRVDKLNDPVDDADAVQRQKHRVLIHFNARDFEVAAEQASKLCAMAREAGLRFDTAAALHNLGDACDRLGDHPRAYAAFVESLEITRALEHDRLTALNKMHLCVLDALRKDTSAEERLKALIRFADGKGFLWDVLEGRFQYARMLLHQGDKDGARKQLEVVIEMAERHGHELIGVDARELLATIE